MVKEAAKPHHNQQNQGGSKQQQQYRPINKGGKEAEPAAPTKKQIEERQQNLLQENIKKLEEDIRKHEHGQKAAYPGLEKAYQLALDKNKQLERIPELSAHWVDKTGFLPFLPQDNLTDKTEEVIQYHNVDISNLLKKKYHQFWSQIVYDESLQSFLDSYLRFCERPYPPFSPTVSSSPIRQEDVAGPYERDIGQQNLFKRVYSVLARISNYEETTSLHMDHKFFANLIYDKKLWDLPKMLDVCVLYGPRNKEKTTKMITRLFELQPKFNDDLSKLLPVIEKTLGDSATRISSTVVYESVVDVGSFMLDAAATLRALLSIYIPASHHVLEYPALIYRIVNIYETVLPAMEKVILAEERKKGYVVGIEAIKYHFLEAVFLLVQHCVEYFVLKSQGKNSPCSLCRELDPSTQAEVVVSFLVQLANAAQQTTSTRKDKGKAANSSGTGGGGGSGSAKPGQKLIKDLDKEFGLKTLLNQLKDTHPSIDNARINIVLAELGETATTSEQTKQPLQQQPTKPQQQPAKQPEKQQQQTTKQPTPAPTSTQEVDVQKLSLISQVKDLFPELGDGFIDLGLQYYNNNTERLINALLEGSLPPDLERVDKTLKAAPTANVNTSAPTTTTTDKPKQSVPVRKEQPMSLLAQRRNVFDGDEFDIMRNNRIDKSKIITSKKNEKFDFDDKERAELKSIILERTLNEDFGEYDDEYDDSYDEFNKMEVGAEGESLNDDEESKKKAVNKTVAGAAVAEGAGTSSESDGAGSSEEEAASTPGQPQTGGGRGGQGAGRGSSEPAGSSRGRGGKRGGYHKFKAHNQKDRAAKKRGFGGPPPPQ